jgi:ribosome-associated protein
MRDAAADEERAAVNEAQARLVVSRLHGKAGRSRRGRVVSLDVTVGGITIPPEELSWRFSRSQGPGGQSVNTTDSQAELSFNLAVSVALPPLLRERALAALAGRLSGGVITVTASEYRSQLRNREAAAARLSQLLTEATAPPPPPRRPTRPTRSATERRLADKQRRSEVKRLRRSAEE